VPWVSAGRGAATRRRAQAADLTDAGTLPQLVARSQLVMSVGPPHAATDVARTVAALGFGGIYVDANAVAPTDLEAVVLAGDVVAASALKMCYAAWTKGTSALLLAIRAAAAAHGVEAALAAEWERTQPGLAARSQAAAGTARKAWRFAGEMDQIAACLAEAGLPDDVDRDLHRRSWSSVLKPVCGVPVLGPAHSRPIVRSDSIPMVSDRSLQYVDDAWSVLMVVNRAEDASRLEGHRTHSKLAPCHALDLRAKVNRCQ
jgi:hypothetical protein